MVPRVDTLSPVYLIPGSIVLLGVAILLWSFSVWSGIHLRLYEMTPASGAVALVALVPVAYVLGYYCWCTVGDHKTQYNAFMVFHMLKYVALNAPLRTSVINSLNTMGYAALSDAIGSLVQAGCRDGLHSSDSAFPVGSSDTREEEKQRAVVEEQLGRNAEHFGVPMLVWDAVYDRNNPNCIGRMLSSWNNYKFAITTQASLLYCAVLTVFGLVLASSWVPMRSMGVVRSLRSWHGSASDDWDALPFFLATMLCISALVLYRLYSRVCEWRAKTFARDLVYGLRRKDFGGIG